MVKLRTIAQKFKSFKEIEEDTQISREPSGDLVVRDTKYYRVPNTLEASMEKVNKAWRFYSKKFVQNPKMSSLVTKMSIDGDINASTHLKIALDMKEQMEAYKKARDLDGMVQTMRTMFGMIILLGYKRGKHKDDEYDDVNMKEQAERLMINYGLLQPKKKEVEQPNPSPGLVFPEAAVKAD